MKKLVIVQIIPTLNEGGAERFVVDLSNALVNKEHIELHLIVFFDIENKMFLAQDLNKNVIVHTLGKRLGFDYRIIFKLSKLIRKIQPDVVNTHLASFEYNILSSLIYKCKYFHTLHSDAAKECANKKKRQLRKIFYSGNYIRPITISQESSNSFRTIYGLENDKIIYNGRSPLERSNKFSIVEEEFYKQYKITPNTKVILNIGSIQESKNQFALAQAVNKLTEQGQDIVLLIVGGMREGGESIYEKIVGLNNPRIFLLGVKSNVQDYLFLSDIFCLSSIYEGMPISLIEAFSAPCLAACTPVGGIVNMIKDGFNGLLAQNDSVDAISEVLNTAINLSKEQIQTMNLNAHRKFMENYSINFCADQYLQFYNSEIR